VETFVINLKDSIDRRNKISKNLDFCGYKNVFYFDAVEPNDIDKFELLYDKNYFRFKKGTLACALSHINLLKKIESSNKNGPFFVLEDDIIIKKSCKYLVDLIFNFLNDVDPDWDIVYFSWGKESNTQKIWEGQQPIGFEDTNFGWDKLGKILDFYFIRKIKSYPKVINIFEWGENYINWANKDIYKYGAFQHLINQSAYIVNKKRIKKILSTITPIDKAIDVKVLENYEKLNIYMLSPALDVIIPEKDDSKSSIRLKNDYKKQIDFIWPKQFDILNKNYNYIFKVRIHKSLIHNEHPNFIKSKSKFILNKIEINSDFIINGLETLEDFCEIQLELDKYLLAKLNYKNEIEFRFETFWEKKIICRSLVFFIN
jgi:GR25 family glycosyltransferase involved in LPS biosynthesis